jgi:uncharacterized membrane protein
MKKVLLSLLAVIVALGLFAAAGYAGYRFGYIQGVQTTAKGNAAPSQSQPRPFNGFGLRRMPMQRFGFERGFRRGGFPMMGFGLFAIFGTLVRIAVIVLIVWFIYWLFARSGWRLTRTTQTTAPPPPNNENVNQDTEAKQ